MPGIVACLYHHEDLISVEHRHVQVEEDQQRRSMIGLRIVPLFEQEVDGLLAVIERNDLIGNASPAQVLLDQTGVSGIIFNKKNRYWLLLGHDCLLNEYVRAVANVCACLHIRWSCRLQLVIPRSFLLRDGSSRQRRTGIFNRRLVREPSFLRDGKMKCRSRSRNGFTPDVPAMTSHQGLYACQAHPFCGLVLFSYPSEHFKCPGDLFIRDAAAVIADGKDGPSGIRFGGYLDLSGNSGSEVLYRVVQDVAEDHL